MNIMNSNNDLIQHLINSGALHSYDIIEAFEHVDRVDFVVNPYASDVYADHPLQIGDGQTISQPTTVAMMMEMLKPVKGQKILDIGSGSGWTTALLSFIVGKSGSVLGMERIPQLIEFGNSNLNKYNITNAKIIPAKTELGMVGEEFDRILVSAAAVTLPMELIEQLKVGGKLVVPVNDSIYELTKGKNKVLKSIRHYGFRFVPLIY